MWLSLVEHSVRDRRVAGSNPVIPTIDRRLGQLQPLIRPETSPAHVRRSRGARGRGQKVSHLAWDQGIKGVRFSPPPPSSAIVISVLSERKQASQRANSVKGSQALTEAASKRRLEYDSNPVRCRCCGGPIEYAKKSNLFCSRSCSASVNNRGVTRNPRKPTIPKTRAKGTGISAASWARLGSMSYRLDELPVKLAVESEYGRAFNKAGVYGRYFDFADDVYLIEHTVDSTKGVSDAIERFQSARSAGDSRHCVLFAPKSRIGKARMSRLESAGVEVRDVDELKRCPTYS